MSPMEASEVTKGGQVSSDKMTKTLQRVEKSHYMS